MDQAPVFHSLQDLSDGQAEQIVGGSNGVGTPDFVNTWHGLGSGHQGNNNPGDTASDRHNFDQATAGNSGVNPTDNGNGAGNG